MKGPAIIAAAVVVAALLVLASFVFFTVGEREQAIVLEFGRPVGEPINAPGTEEAGLHAKLPWQNVIRFSRQNLEFDSQPVQPTVANEERLVVDAFVRYRIVDPLQYYRSLSSGTNSSLRLREAFNTQMRTALSDAIRGVLGNVQIRDIITTRRTELMDAIQARVAAEALKYGVNVIDVRIRQADFPPENARNVYARMKSDYQQQAERTRAEGQRRAQVIEAQANKEVVQITANAEREAEIIRGEADATRNCIFAGAYQGAPVEITGVGEDIVVDQINVDRIADEDSRPIPAASLDLDTNIAEIDEGDTAVTCRFLSGGQGDEQREEFFAFYRSLQAYETSLSDQGETTIVLSPQSEFFRYFNRRSGQ